MALPLKFIAAYLANLKQTDPSKYEMLELEERVLYDASPLGVVADEISQQAQQEYTFNEQSLQEIAELMAAEGAMDGPEVENQIVSDLLELDALINTADADLRQELVFIDENVEDLGSYIDEAAEGVVTCSTMMSPGPRASNGGRPVISANSTQPSE